MRTQAIQVYQFNELDEDIKEKVLNTFRAWDNYGWHDSNNDTLKAFEKVFPVTVKDYDYTYHNDINFRVYVDEDIEDLRGVRLMKFIINNFGDSLFKKAYLRTIKGKARYSKIKIDTCCVLTGYCIDDDILEPVYNFLKKPDKNQSLGDIINDCLWSFIHACNRDYEYSNSDEALTEFIEANEYEFTIDGEIF